MDEIYYNSTSRGRIPVSDMCDEHIRRAFKKLLRENQTYIELEPQVRELTQLLNTFNDKYSI
mgnify:CR=1 FL=1